ncbi:MAG: phosphoadenosine phosphosulfate reductase family protein [Oscillospiraceae bacterium]|nr:phosphoadenosine phosphosulfate reductase family protein [Oscillospiraceae bacterium]
MYKKTIDDYIKEGDIYKKSPQYKRKREKAISYCREALEKSQKAYAAISGGKDSVAMAYIVNEAAQEVGKDFRLWLHCSDASFPETLETCQRVAEELNRPLDVYKSEVSAFDIVGQGSKQKFGKRGVFFDSVKEYAKDFDTVFTGVRAYESARRMRAAKAHGAYFHSQSMGNVWVCNPLQWFELGDVFATLRYYNAPIHPIYYKAPITRDEFIRLGYITQADLYDAGAAYFIKLNYPDIYAKLAEAFPEVGRFV